jgi:hypothetical protein
MCEDSTIKTAEVICEVMWRERISVIGFRVVRGRRIEISCEECETVG